MRFPSFHLASLNVFARVVGGGALLRNQQGHDECVGDGGEDWGGNLGAAGGLGCGRRATCCDTDGAGGVEDKTTVQGD